MCACAQFLFHRVINFLSLNCVSRFFLIFGKLEKPALQCFTLAVRQAAQIQTWCIRLVHTILLLQEGVQFLASVMLEKRFFQKHTQRKANFDKVVCLIVKIVTQVSMAVAKTLEKSFVSQLVKTVCF